MIYPDRMARERMDECPDRGGHFWNDAPVGQSRVCTQCDKVGALNAPAVNLMPEL